MHAKRDVATSWFKAQGAVVSLIFADLRAASINF